MSSIAAESKNLVRAWFEVFNTGDFTAVESIHAADCRNHAPGPFDVSDWPAAGRHFGPAEFRQTVEWIRSSQPDLHITIDSIIADGDQVVSWIHATGTPTQARGPIPPTGATVSFDQAHRFRIERGKIAEHWAVRDDLRSMVQAGVVVPPTGGRA